MMTCRRELPATVAASPPGSSDSCNWCGDAPIPRRARWCSKACRQTAWRARRIAVAEDLGDAPKRLAYADPPYPGTARKYYQHEATYGGEVDHAELVSLLQPYDGWALSTSARALREILPLCPEGVRVAAWVKPNGASARTRGPHNLWEPVIYQPARLRRPGKRDWVSLKPARGGGTLPGRKPLGFCMWLFELLGASLVDDLDDIYPGSGIVGRAWGQYRNVAPRARRQGQLSLAAADDSHQQQRLDR